MEKRKGRKGKKRKKLCSKMTITKEIMMINNIDRTKRQCCAFEQ